MNLDDLPPFSPRPTGVPHALDGLRVIDFTHFLAGPYCTLILADCGADVIKVENVGPGDDFRLAQPQKAGDEGAPFAWANRGKRSLAVDLRSEAGIEIVLELVKNADIVVENFSTGVMQRFGLDYERLSALNPRLIYCSISAYGRTGPFAGRLGFDPVLQAESGLMSVNGVSRDQPVAHTVPIVDITTGMMASNAILAAVCARASTGKGQYVQATLLDQAVTMLNYLATGYLIDGNDPGPMGNQNIFSVPVGVYSARDGDLFICCANERTYQRLARDVFGRDDLLTDPRFSTNAGRTANFEAFVAIMADILKDEDRSVWVDKMRQSGVPAGPVATIAEALESEEIRSREIFSAVPLPDGRAVPNMALPFRLEGTPLADPGPAPAHGEHTSQILHEILAYGEAAIADLMQDGVIQGREA